MLLAVDVFWAAGLTERLARLFYELLVELVGLG